MPVPVIAPLNPKVTVPPGAIARTPAVARAMNVLAVLIKFPFKTTSLSVPEHQWTGKALTDAPAALRDSRNPVTSPLA